eukprot:jgi/Mesvir1/6092/Mv00809-RA.1
MEGKGMASWLVTGGRPRELGLPVNHGIVPATNYRAGGRHHYARSDGTDTIEAFEEVIGGLEGGTAVAYGSGMAAISAVLELVPVGGTVAIPRDCYHGVSSLVSRGEESGRWSVIRVERAETESWLEALDADLLFAESPSNPMLQLMDIDTLCEAARSRKCKVVVDATFATPLRMHALERGADVVIHSATKYIGGHSDLLLGVVVAKDGTVVTRLQETRSLHGAVPGALEAFLALRGLRTLHIRLDAMERNAAVIVERLRIHPLVSQVHYPGFGAVISFETEGAASTELANDICSQLRMIVHTTSFGGVESTMQCRSGYPGAGHLPPGLIRLNVGIEDVEDIWADLSGAIEAVVPETSVRSPMAPRGADDDALGD